MIRECLECFATMTIPDNIMKGEIIECKDCGQSYEMDERLNLKTAETVSEDWGE